MSTYLGKNTGTRVAWSDLTSQSLRSLSGALSLGDVGRVSFLDCADNCTMQQFAAQSLLHTESCNVK